MSNSEMLWRERKGGRELGVLKWGQSGKASRPRCPEEVREGAGLDRGQEKEHSREQGLLMLCPRDRVGPVKARQPGSQEQCEQEEELGS